MKMLIGMIGSLLILGCGEERTESPLLPYYNDSTLTPLFVADDSVEGRVTHQVGDFRLTDQNGREVTGEMMEGRITVIDFFFTRCPGICPTLSDNLARLQDSLSDVEDLLLLSFSVTPDIDSVPILKDYAESYGADDDRWRLMTGDRELIYSFARTSLFADVDTGQDSFLHSETFFLIDRERRIRGVYNGTLGPEVVNLIADVRGMPTGDR